MKWDLERALAGPVRLADLAQVVQPQLNIVEGVIGRDGTGFHRGRNYALGLVIAGINMVAVDSVASYLIGFDPRELIYLQVAAAAGLGCNDLSRLKFYVAEGNRLSLCGDLEPMRARPPFHVIRDILGEAEYPFAENHGSDLVDKKWSDWPF